MTRRWPNPWRAVLACLLALCLQGGARAEHQAELVIDGAYRYDLVPHLLHAEDPTDRWWPYDAEGRLLVSGDRPTFLPLSGPEAIARLGFSDHPQWFHIRLRHIDSSPQRRWLVVANPHLDRIDLLIGSHGRLVAHDRGGDLLPFDHRTVPHRQHVFPIDLLTGDEVDLYLRVWSGSSLDAPIQIWMPEALIRRDHAIYLLLGLYFGITAGLVGHALVLYAAMRDQVYLVYAGMRAAVGLGLLAMSGLGAEFIWTEGGHWNRTWQQTGLTLSGLLAVQFARGFLDTRDRVPWIDHALKALGGIWLTCFIVTSLWTDHPLVQALLFLAVFTIGVLLLVGGHAMHHRQIGGAYFFLAWSASLAGSLLELLIRLGFWIRPDVITQPLVIGSTVDMVLMAFALGERIRAERRAKQQAQALQIREAARLHELRRTSAEKSRLLAAVSHDLRQPVYAITLATQSLAHQPDRPVPAFTLMQMREAIASADHLLDSLHTMSRLEAGALRPQVNSFSIQPLLERIDVVYGLQARAKGLRWTVTPGLTWVRSDPILLERILGNLAANAVRYTQRGGVVIACRPRRDGLLIQVWDTGLGIPADQLDAIFAAYFRGVAETETDNGVGLGLFIVRQSSLLLGIQLGVRSRPGRGSCFWIKVPLALDVGPQPAGAPVPRDR